MFFCLQKSERKGQKKEKHRKHNNKSGPRWVGRGMTKAAEEGKGEQSLFHGLTTPDLAVLNILTSCVISDSNSDDNEQQKDGEEEDDCRG